MFNMTKIRASNAAGKSFYANHLASNDYYSEHEKMVGFWRGSLAEKYGLAGRVGQVVNMSDLAGDIGISSAPLSSWLSVLEASYIVFRLPCYFRNFGKRLIKAPKIYSKLKKPRSLPWSETKGFA